MSPSAEPTITTRAAAVQTAVKVAETLMEINAYELEEILEQHGPREVRICDMDAPLHQLIDECGRRYEEVETNIWGRLLPQGERRVLYLGTGRHGGGIILRSLYVKLEDGSWVNGSTRVLAPFPEQRKLVW